MPTTKPVPAGLITGAVVAALLTGCSSATPNETTDQACAAAGAFEAAVNEFTDLLTPESTAGEVRAAREEVQRTFEELMREGEDVAENRVETLNKAVAQFESAVGEVPDDAPLAESVASLQEEAAKVDAARDDFVGDLNCR